MLVGEANGGQEPPDGGKLRNKLGASFVLPVLNSQGFNPRVGGGKNEMFLACKNFLTAAATRAANKAGYTASLDVSKVHVPSSDRT